MNVLIHQIQIKFFHFNQICSKLFRLIIKKKRFQTLMRYFEKDFASRALTIFVVHLMDQIIIVNRISGHIKYVEDETNFY